MASQEKRKEVSTDFIYCVVISISLLIAIACLVSIAPLSIFLITKPRVTNHSGIDRYKKAVETWNDGKMEEFKQQWNLELELKNEKGDLFHVPLEEINEDKMIPGKQMRKFSIPSYDPVQYSLDDVVLYRNLTYKSEKDLDQVISIVFKPREGEEMEKLSLNVPVFNKFTRTVSKEADCKGELVSRLTCRSIWRLTGFCGLVDYNQEDNDFDYASYIEGKQSAGCVEGEDGEWFPGTYSEQIEPSDKMYELKGPITIRSKYDPEVTANYETNGTFSFVTRYYSKFIMGIVLISVASVTAIVCCCTSCCGLFFCWQTKRLESKYNEYSDLSENPYEAEPLVADDDDASEDEVYSEIE